VFVLLSNWSHLDFYRSYLH